MKHNKHQQPKKSSRKGGKRRAAGARSLIQYGDDHVSRPIQGPSVAELGAMRISRQKSNLVELKYILNSKQTGGGSALALAPTPAVPTVTLLNGMSRNTTVQSRVGDKVELVRLVAKLSAFCNTANATPGFSIRFIVVQDKEANGTALTTSELFGLTNPSPNALYNFNNRNIDKKFTVYLDTVIDLGGTASQLPSFKNFDFDLKFKIPVGYERGNAGTVADIDTGALYLVCITDNSDGTNNTNVTGETALWFWDY